MVKQSKKIGGAERAAKVKGDGLAARIKALRKSLDMGQVEFGKRMGVNQSTVSKWERGEDKPRSPDSSFSLASLAGKSIDEFFDLRKPSRKVNEKFASGKTVRVVGAIQAGSWREAIEWDYDDQYEVPLPPLPGVPDVPLRAYRVDGPSMNRLYPEDSMVFVTPLIGSGIKLESGMRVFVSRRNSDGLYEATVKEYVVNPDGTKWLWPRSYDPNHQAPIQYRDKKSEEVVITGVVMAVSIIEYNRKRVGA